MTTAQTQIQVCGLDALATCVTALLSLHTFDITHIFAIHIEKL